MINLNLNQKNVFSKVDLTLLTKGATKSEIIALCDKAINYGVASICVPPAYVDFVFGYVRNQIPICTVIGFPNGYTTTAVKCYEVRDAIARGASEIDMVININDLKNSNYGKILNEINIIKLACENRILKVIVETSQLTEREKIKICKIIGKSNADYIKTSTGFDKGGATIDDIKLFKKYLGNNKKIKASGGIRTFEEAEAFILEGCDRIGSSKIIDSFLEKQKQGENNDK